MFIAVSVSFALSTLIIDFQEQRAHTYAEHIMDWDEVIDTLEGANFVSVDEESSSDEDSWEEIYDSDEGSWESYDEAIVSTAEEIRQEEEYAEIANYLTLEDFRDDKDDDELGEKMIVKFQQRLENEIISVLCTPGAAESDDFRVGRGILYNVTRRVMSMMIPKFISDGKASYVLEEDSLYRLFGKCLVCNAVVH